MVPEEGGAGAGSLPTDPSEIIDSGAGADPQPVTTRKQRPVPATSSPAPIPSPSDSPSDPGSSEPSAPPSDEPSGEPSDPPTESATDPVPDPDPSEDDTPELPEPEESSSSVIIPEGDAIPVAA